jgi:secernin
MCDTLAALPSAALRGGLLFAKNSDRERNEAQFLEMTPRGRYAPGTMLAATYVSIPQAPATRACLLSRPFWTWGAEMGANEHGVVIGNEALHSILPAQRKRALIGMDLVRLGLERGATAAQALAVIIEMLETHGQGGDCGHLGRFYYHNGFIIADATEAYVLETVGRWWVAERVRGTRALSNALSITDGYDDISPALTAHAKSAFWLDAEGRFDVANRLIDAQRDAVSFGRGRCARGTALLARDTGRLTPATMMAALRDHGEAAEHDPAWTPADTVGRTICMHAAQGPRRSQTTGSMVSELRSGRVVHWVTGTSAPCLSVFKPVMFETGLPPQGPRPSDQNDGASLWWRHERVHRAALGDFAAWSHDIAAERDALEASFVDRLDAAEPAALKAVVAACWREAEALEARWAAALSGRRPRSGGQGAFTRSWARLNHVAGVQRL